MKPSEYIKQAKRTEPSKYRFGKTGDVTPRIEHSIIGIVTEAGEIMDAIKRAKIYGNKLDRIHLIEELGDLMWYIALLTDELKTSFEEIWDKNIRKLKVRYPEKFTEKKANNRDLQKERHELEK
jgi:NTP pyrophosphatase (non-canonical NTP hydrolase)